MSPTWFLYNLMKRLMPAVSTRIWLLYAIAMLVAEQPSGRFAVAADLPAPPRVAGFERFSRPLLTGTPVADTDAIEAGLLLLGELGCVNCHTPSDRLSRHLHAKAGPVLDRVGQRLRPAWLAEYLERPRQVHAGSTMPDVLAGLPEAERRERVAAISYLLRATGESVDAAPDWFGDAKADAGAKLFAQSGCATCHLATRAADTGALPDRLPLAELATKWSARELEAFLKDPFAVRPAGRMPATTLHERDRRHIVAYLLEQPDGANKGGDLTGPSGVSEETTTQLLAAGRTHFAASGCANCHHLRVGKDSQPIASTVAAGTLATLPLAATGCLAESPAAGLPRYDLDAIQRQAMQAAIGWLQSAAAAEAPARERSIDRLLTALNCYACHSRAEPGQPGKGGVLPTVALFDEDDEPVLKEPARDELFTGKQKELGDEGRLPPTLTAVGDKLRPGFINEVLLQGGRDRGETLWTLMPKWHQPTVAALAELLAADPRTPQPIPPLTGHPEAEVIEQGRHLVGAKALGCIKCHAFGGEKGQSLGLIDMTRMPRRLRHEWFLAYVEEPQRFRPGTRMPASWPNGKSFFPDILDGTAAGQIEAVWRYIAAAKPRPPVGAGKNPIELVPAERPIIYRNFIEGAGPRAIAVGSPEGVHFAWDADQLRLALVWQGGFLDAGRHWSGRGQGFQPPLGKGLFAPDLATPLASFASDSEIATAAWPAGSNRNAEGPVAGFRFRGYQLDEAGWPRFRWQWLGRTVEETYEPITSAAAKSKRMPVGLRRRLTIQGKPLPAAAFRVARGKSIQIEPDGWYRVDGYWRVRLTGSNADQMTQVETAGQVELRLPLVLANGRVTIEEELAW